MLTTSMICCRVRPNFTVTAWDSFNTGLSDITRLQNIVILKIFSPPPWSVTTGRFSQIHQHQQIKLVAAGLGPSGGEILIFCSLPNF